MKQNFMQRNFIFTLVFLSLIFIIFSACNNKSIKNLSWEEDEIQNPKYLDFITEADDFLINNNFQGSVLIGKNKKIIFAKGYGFSDKYAEEKVQNTIQSTYEIGSVCKQMTAAAIMQLAEKNKLSIDDKLSKYFPDYKYGDNITIKLLLTMHSGLIDHINAPEDFFPRKIYHKISKCELDGTPLEKDIVLNYLYSAPLLTKPGKTYFYCNTDYYLLAKIVEIVSGETFEDYIRSNIFDRCGMYDSNQIFHETSTKGYDYKKRYYSIPSEFAFGCGDVNSNVLDLFKWNTEFSEGRVVNKKSFGEMINSESYGYGVYCDNRSEAILHGGTTNVFNAYNIYFINEKLSIIVLSNTPSIECNTTEIAGKLRKIWKNFEKNTKI